MPTYSGRLVSVVLSKGRTDMWEIIEIVAGIALIIWIFELHRKVDRLTVDVLLLKRDNEDRAE